MRPARVPALVLSLCAAATLTAQYTYYYSDTLTSVDSSKWYTNGTVSTATSGLSASGSGGGALISKVAIPDGTARYEVKTNLTLPQSGGEYTLYLEASSDALYNSSAPAGSFVAFDLQSVSVSNGACTATLVAYTRVSGVLTQMGSTQIVCHDGMELHAVATNSSQFYIYGDGVYYLYFTAYTVPSGKPGIGARDTPSGSYIRSAALGPIDTVAPPQVSSASIATASFPNRIDIQWTGVADDANGIGIWGYQVFRNGSYIGLKRSPEFSDTTVAASTTYSYELYPADWHANDGPHTTFSVTTPATGNIDPRKPGLRPLANYWGGLGEQIDMQSGNLNYTFPFLKILGRGGFSVPINLSYNSQTWRKDTLTTPNKVWKLGQDLGYGYGWRLQAGSLTPFYSDYWTVNHWQFIDSSGAIYRLDQQSGTKWTTKEGVFVTWDTATRKLYFNDGTWWQFDVASAGHEDDAGSYYPSLMQDTNGNQLS